MSGRTNKQIRDALLQQLHCSPQALSQRVKRLAKQLPMSTPHAVYVIAHQQGIRVDKHLGPEEVATVRQLVRDLAIANGDPAAARQRAGAKREVRPVVIRTANPPGEEYSFLTAADAANCKRMSDLYPHVYLFENSVRRFIRRVLEHKFGDQWESRIPTQVRNIASDRMKQHGHNAWHSTPSADLLAYVDIKSLTTIINVNSRQFAPLFQGIEDGYRWLTSKLNHIELHRNVIAHNNPLGKDNAAELALYCKQWQRQAKGIERILDASAKAGKAGR